MNIEFMWGFTSNYREHYGGIQGLECRSFCLNNGETARKEHGKSNENWNHVGASIIEIA